MWTKPAPTDALLTTALLAFFLGLWRLGYAYSDAAALALLPVAVLVFSSYRPLLLEAYRARRQVQLRAQSPLSRYLTGWLQALLRALGLTLMACFVLAWQALSTSWGTFALLLVVCFLAALAFSLVLARLAQHLQPPFDQLTAIQLTTWLVVLLSAIVFVWKAYAVDLHPGTLQSATLPQALQLGVDQLPRRRGWIAELLAPLFAWESGKAWLAVQLQEQRWAAALLSLDYAVFGFVAAKSATILANRVRAMRARRMAPEDKA